ncbi:MAG: hypothetical protein KC776_16860 [Myxococcales bacterium]|nr:hypothetical protein [Myxococcales bacterium]MCB9575518.1 hypothetical protein [Polyangiaceae bacterium]
MSHQKIDDLPEPARSKALHVAQQLRNAGYSLVTAELLAVREVENEVLERIPAATHESVIEVTAVCVSTKR